MTQFFTPPGYNVGQLIQDLQQQNAQRERQALLQQDLDMRQRSQAMQEQQFQMALQKDIKREAQQKALSERMAPLLTQTPDIGPAVPFDNIIRQYIGASAQNPLADNAHIGNLLKMMQPTSPKYHYGTDAEGRPFRVLDKPGSQVELLSEIRKAAAKQEPDPSGYFSYINQSFNPSGDPNSEYARNAVEALTAYGMKPQDVTLPQTTVKTVAKTTRGAYNLSGDFKPDVSDKPPTNININTPSSDDVETLARMVANGEMAPSQLPKRQGLYNRVVARAKDINPQFNPREADANFALARNPGFRQRGITAQALPEILSNVVEAGKKVNYPDVKFAGVIKKWGLGQINDPALTEYMALRNDSLMEIASVMRMNGVTDQATLLESEAMSPTMSPRALDAWLSGQLKALKPRLQRFEKIVTSPSGTTVDISLAERITAEKKRRGAK